MRITGIILVSLVLCAGVLVVKGWAWEQKLTASDAAAWDAFGCSVSISGDYAIVGAYLNDDAGEWSGSAYIFYRNQGGADKWGEVKKLTASDAAEEDWFGCLVSISGDYAVVGAFSNDDAGEQSGSAYVYHYGIISQALSLNEFGRDGSLKVAGFQMPDKAVTVEFWMNSGDSDNDGTPVSYAVSGSDNEFLIYNYCNQRVVFPPRPAAKVRWPEGTISDEPHIFLPCIANKLNLHGLKHDSIAFHPAFTNYFSLELIGTILAISIKITLGLM